MSREQFREHINLIESIMENGGSMESTKKALRDAGFYVTTLDMENPATNGKDFVLYNEDEERLYIYNKGKKFSMNKQELIDFEMPNDEEREEFEQESFDELAAAWVDEFFDDGRGWLDPGDDDDGPDGDTGPKTPVEPGGFVLN